MTNEGLAVLIAGFAKLLAGIIVHCTMYAAGDPRAESRSFHIRRVNEISKEIEEHAEKIIKTYRATNK